MKNLKNISPSLEFEKQYSGKVVVGIDEAGRGPISGPVVAGLAYLSLDQYCDKEILSVNDSKKLSKKKRGDLYEYLLKNIKFGIGAANHEEIDEINILNATKLAMFRAYKDFTEKYSLDVDVALIDGNFNPFVKHDVDIDVIVPIVKGDQKSISIACASIIAKEWRDAFMLDLHGKFPKYSWDKNNGYPTKLHIEKINEYGITKYHRKSFAPVRRLLI